MYTKEKYSTTLKNKNSRHTSIHRKEKSYTCPIPENETPNISIIPRTKPLRSIKEVIANGNSNSGGITIEKRNNSAIGIISKEQGLSNFFGSLLAKQSGSLIPIPIMPKNINDLKIMDKKQQNFTSISSKSTDIYDDILSNKSDSLKESNPNILTNIQTQNNLQILRKFRHLVFSPEISEEILYKHIKMVHNGLLYCNKLCKNGIYPICESKQITLMKNGKELQNTTKKTLILDLDETLVTIAKNGEKGDVYINIGKGLDFHVIGVKIRPFAQEFINNMSKIFEIIIFTSAKYEYGQGVATIFDPDNTKISCILNRSHCLITKNGLSIKDLRILKNRDLKNIIIVDNLTHSFALQLWNGIPILEWFGDRNDMELKYLEKYLICLSECKDIIEYNKQYLKLDELSELQVV